MNLDESVVVSFQDYGNREEKKEFVRECFRRGRHLILLAIPDLSPSGAAAWLLEQGVSARVPVLAGSILTLPEEQVVRTRLARLIGREFPWLSVSVFINPRGPKLENDVRNWRLWRQRQLSSIKKRR